MKLFTLCAGLLAVLFSLAARAQGVTIGAAGPPDASATLEVRSTAGGLLLPRLTSAQRVAIAAPAAGLLVFQTDNSPSVYYFDGTRWRNLVDGTLAAPVGVATTLAGSGTAAFADGTGPAAQFRTPIGVACDGNGNVFVADTDNNRIRRIVAATGAVTTLAGSTVGFADGTGPAAQFNSPTGVACDGGGNVFVADADNNRIRRIVAATGAVTTLAGSGASGFADGTGTNARFFTPIGVACDGIGNVFVADADNHCIRRIVAATGAVTTLAGSGTAAFADGTGPAAQFNSPTGVACDGRGNVYVADFNNQRIRCIVAVTGVVTTLAGSAFGFADGQGTAAQFRTPYGVACDASGNVFVADFGNHRIRRIVAATGVVTTLAGSGTFGFADGTGPAAQFRSPRGVACDASGTVYVADTGNQRIRVLR